MSLQVHPRTPFLDVVEVNLAQLIALPDQEAAESMQVRMACIERVEEMHERSYAEVGIIAGQFQKRELWRLVDNPMSGEPFISWSAWASSSGIRCRRIIFESKKDMERLGDVPADRLIEVPKGNLKVLIQLSTQVRNQDDILEAAKTMEPSDFLEKIETEQPFQHVESRTPMVIKPGRSDRKIIERWSTYAQTHDLAGSLTEAIVRACEQCLIDHELDELHPVPDEVEA